jgi:transcriptional regulator with XRE-family HTH domain
MFGDKREYTGQMRSESQFDEALLKAHRLHFGLYRRVADKLGVDASYVSRVATGEREGLREGLRIRRALLDELRKIHRGLAAPATK